MGINKHHLKMYFDLKKQFEENQIDYSNFDDFYTKVSNDEQLSSIEYDNYYWTHRNELMEGHLCSVLEIIKSNLNHRNFDDWNKNEPKM